MLYKMIATHYPTLRRCAHNCAKSWNNWQYMYQQGHKMYNTAIDVANASHQLPLNLSWEDDQYRLHIDKYAYKCGQAGLAYMRCAQYAQQGNMGEATNNFNEAGNMMNSVAPNQDALDAKFSGLIPL